MILEIKVDLADIYNDGESDVGEIIEDRVIAEIAKAIRKDIEKETLVKISARIAEVVDGWILEEITKFTDRKITITDKWGDPKEYHESVNDLLKAKFDSFLTEKVDKDGKTISACGYGSGTNRID